MISYYETNPDFAHYSTVHMTTQNIAKYFDEKSDHYKGFVTSPVTYQTHKTMYGSPILKPLVESLAYGQVMYIHQI
jgi:hypothetical protein